MGTRFLLTSDCVVPDSVKAEYLKRTVNDTVVTSVLDGVPQRVLRTELVERLLEDGRVARLSRSLRHAVASGMMSLRLSTIYGRRTTAMVEMHCMAKAKKMSSATAPPSVRS